VILGLCLSKAATFHGKRRTILKKAISKSVLEGYKSRFKEKEWSEKEKAPIFSGLFL
jgi:hypothetical protein